MSQAPETFTDPLERLLADRCTPKQVGAIEAGGDSGELWRRLHDSGFMDALVLEKDGGAGIGLSEAFPILYLCGKYAVPVPLSQTLIARALLTRASRPIPAGPITIAATTTADGGAIECARVPYGRVAQWVLVKLPHHLDLFPVSAARVTPTGVYGSLEADVRWDPPPDAAPIDVPIDTRVLGACLYAAQLAGAMARVLDITVRYANERAQFGRSIGKFQAIQHQLSVMAEQVSAARMAAQMSCHGSSHLPDARLTAVGKARASEAAAIVAAIGHAVHGAMGFTAEYELQNYTRRLHEWRLAYGSEAYWTERIGAELLTGNESALDFIRHKLFPTVPAPETSRLR
jgi:acyl-CoA dehydrogenase